VLDLSGTQSFVRYPVPAVILTMVFRVDDTPRIGDTESPALVGNDALN